MEILLEVGRDDYAYIWFLFHILLVVGSVIILLGMSYCMNDFIGALLGLLIAAPFLKAIYQSAQKPAGNRTDESIPVVAPVAGPTVGIAGYHSEDNGYDDAADFVEDEY